MGNKRAEEDSMDNKEVNDSLKDGRRSEPIDPSDEIAIKDGKKQTRKAASKTRRPKGGRSL